MPTVLFGFVSSFCFFCFCLRRFPILLKPNSLSSNMKSSTSITPISWNFLFDLCVQNLCNISSFLRLSNKPDAKQYFIIFKLFIEPFARDSMIFALYLFSLPSSLAVISGTLGGRMVIFHPNLPLLSTKYSTHLNSFCLIHSVIRHSPDSVTKLGSIPFEPNNNLNINSRSSNMTSSDFTQAINGVCFNPFAASFIILVIVSSSFSNSFSSSKYFNAL